MAKAALRPKYGSISVRHTPREASIARVRVNGEDVTHRCYSADDREGWADCYQRNEQGQVIVVAGEVFKERLYGDVVIDFPRGLD